MTTIDITYIRATTRIALVLPTKWASIDKKNIRVIGMASIDSIAVCVG